jgi:hypothetical protein
MSFPTLIDLLTGAASEYLLGWLGAILVIAGFMVVRMFISRLYSALAATLSFLMGPLRKHGAGHAVAD